VHPRKGRACFCHAFIFRRGRCTYKCVRNWKFVPAGLGILFPTPARMAFLRAEMNLAATIITAGKPDILGEGIRVVPKRKDNFTNFQQLARRLNNLAKSFGGSTRTLPAREQKLVSAPSPVRAIVHSLPKRGLCCLSVPGYNQSVMSTVRDAAEQS
jgi:hypothetical protein